MVSPDPTSMSSSSRSVFLAILTIAALLLSACGGASSNAAKTTATPITTATPAPSITSVYASAGDNALYALRADTGVVRWKYQAMKQPEILGLGTTTMYIVDPADKLLTAISKTDGTLLWKSQAPVCDSDPLTSDATHV